jgi:hypothetical protein
LFPLLNISIENIEDNSKLAKKIQMNIYMEENWLQLLKKRTQSKIEERERKKSENLTYNLCFLI